MTGNQYPISRKDILDLVLLERIVRASLSEKSTCMDIVIDQIGEILFNNAARFELDEEIGNLCEFSKRMGTELLSQELRIQMCDDNCWAVGPRDNKMLVFKKDGKNQACNFIVPQEKRNAAMALHFAITLNYDPILKPGAQALEAYIADHQLWSYMDTNNAFEESLSAAWTLLVSEYRRRLYRDERQFSAEIVPGKSCAGFHLGQKLEDVMSIISDCSEWRRDTAVSLQEAVSSTPGWLQVSETQYIDKPYAGKVLYYGRGMLELHFGVQGILYDVSIFSEYLGYLWGDIAVREPLSKVLAHCDIEYDEGDEMHYPVESSSVYGIAFYAEEYPLEEAPNQVIFCISVHDWSLNR